MGLPDQAALPGSGYRGCWYGNQSGDPKTVEQISTVTAVAADLQKTESWWAVICRGPCLGWTGGFQSQIHPVEALWSGVGEGQ